MGNSRFSEICGRCIKMYSVFEQLCQKKGVTANQVSIATGIRSSAFTDWKHGRSIPKTDKLMKIADYFGVSLDYLLTGAAVTEPPVLEIMQFPEDRTFMYSHAEAVHGILATSTKNDEKKLVELLYSVAMSTFSEERMDTLIAYFTKLSEDQRDFVDSVIERELSRTDS